MSTDRCHSIQVPGSGTNRGNRLLESLLPSFVAVDGRKIEDLKAYALGLATQLKFRILKEDLTEDWDGDWASFFSKKKLIPINRLILTTPFFWLSYRIIFWLRMTLIA